ncbi:MAG: sirohydrochlorin cobaltochelatase [Desulforhopalus sp.]
MIDFSSKLSFHVSPLLTMNIPIIMAAFGTTSSALDTYKHLDRCIRQHFSEKEIHWTCTSKIIAGKLQQQNDFPAIHPEALLHQLNMSGVKSAVVQSLHLFPGREFHSLYRLVEDSPIKGVLGMPILTSPLDYEEVGEFLRPVITARPEQQILVLGHGTNHPCWTGYFSLEKILRQKFHRNIHVGVVEKYPDSNSLVDEIGASGAKAVCIIPLFLVTGMHYRRDIVGDGPQSWTSRLAKHNLSVETIDHGLGLYRGFERLLIRHIEEAEKTLSEL